MADIGLKVVEGVSSGVTPFVEPSKRNIGLLMERERGVENKATYISTLAEDRVRFGGFNSNMYGPNVVRNLFKNALGKSVNLYGVRIIGASSTAATRTATLPGTSTPLTVTAGSQGSSDKGSWGNNLSYKLHYFNVKTVGKWVFEVFYKGSLVETHSGATCAEINTNVNRSSLYVTTSFASEPSTAISNVVGTGTITTVSSATPEVKATASVTVTAAGVAGNIVSISVGSILLGSYTVITSDTVTLVAAGLKNSINAGFHGYTANNTSGALTITAPTGTGATINAVTCTITIIGSPTVNTLAPAFSGGVTYVASGPSITVTGSGTAFDTDLIVGSVIMNTAGVVIGTVATITSATIVVLEAISILSLTAATFSYHKRGFYTNTLTGGVYVAPTESDFYPVPDNVAPKGLAVLDGVDVQIIAVSENHTSTMATSGRDYCAGRGDAVFIANLPFSASETTIKAYATALQSNNTSYIASYNAWVNTSDDNGGFVWCPAVGCVLGAAFIRVPELQGGYIHIPPGGIDSALVDIIDITPNKLSQGQINKYTQSYTTNSIVFLTGKGFYVLTSRSYSTNPLYMSIHIRIQTSYYLRVLADNLSWVTQKPNTPELKKEIYVSCYSFFKTEYDRGAIERSLSFSEACIITCDQNNNPLSQDRKLLNVDIDWIPTECAESIRISLNRNDGLLITKALEA